MSNSTNPGEPVEDEALLQAWEDATAVLYAIVGGMMLIALFGRWHTKVVWVKRYFWVVFALCVVRIVKLSVPQLAYYKPFSGQPPPVMGTSEFGAMMAEWVLYIAGNAFSVISYAIILRLWHNALEIVVGRTSSCPQVSLLYLITLSLAAALVLTVLLVFMSPDTINIVEAFKDMVESIFVAGFFVYYWIGLSSALKQFAQLTKGRTIYVSGREIAIGDRALRKLKRIMWVSALCTLGSAYRAASLTNFVLWVMHLVQENYSMSYIITERFLFFIVTESVPPVAVFFVMMKCRRQGQGQAPQQVAAAAAAPALSNGGYTAPGSRGGFLSALFPSRAQRVAVAGGVGGHGGSARIPGYRYAPVPDNARFALQA